MSPLFASRETRLARRKRALRDALRRTEQYIAKCVEHARRYEILAEEALTCDSQTECDRFLFSGLRWQEEHQRWRVFLLKLQELQMIDHGSRAMQEVVTGIAALNKSLREGLSRTQISNVFEQLEDTTEALSDQFQVLEEQFDTIEPGGSLPETGTPSNGTIPESYMERVASERARLLERRLNGRNERTNSYQREN